MGVGMKTRLRGDTMISVLIGMILLSVVIVASVQGSAGMQLISANMRQLLQGAWCRWMWLNC